ncbi:MAG: amidohydrolase [Planctomycetota bacterium]
MTRTACDLFIDHVTLLDGSRSCIAITGNRITAVGDANYTGARTIDANGKLAMPSLANCHTHAAMVLMRGFGDDMPLKEWLEQRIWPAEQKLTKAACYWGTRLATLEMIRSGCTFFSDMYWNVAECAKAVQESGIRAMLGTIFIKFLPFEEQCAVSADLHKAGKAGEWGDRVRFCIAPHAPYTVEPSQLEWIANFAQEHDCAVHTHLSENAWEVDEIVSAQKMRPAHFMDKLGLLKAPGGFLGAHCVWLDESEFELFTERGATCIHNPCANMKLSVGTSAARAFPYHLARKAGTRVVLGTDGVCSNNNLDLFEEMKFAALLAKHSTGDPENMPAREALALPTTNAAAAMRQDFGRLQAGALADLILVRADDVSFAPTYDFVSNVVYSANGHSVDTTICDGKVLMEGGVLPELAEVRAKAEECIVEMGWRNM